MLLRYIVRTDGTLGAAGEPSHHTGFMESMVAGELFDKFTFLEVCQTYGTAVLFLFRLDLSVFESFKPGDHCGWCPSRRSRYRSG